MERVKHPNGVSELMRSLWEKHQRGEELPKNNVYLVDLGGSDTKIEEIDHPTYPEGTLGYYINRVTFDKIISVEGFKERVSGNLLLVYEAYDFLWSISPEDCPPYANCKSSENRIRIEYDEDSDFHHIRVEFELMSWWNEWSDFMQREVSFNVDIENKPEIWVGALLLKLTDNGCRNIQLCFKKVSFEDSEIRKAAINAVEKTLHSKRWYERIIPFLYPKRKRDMLFNMATLTMVSKLKAEEMLDLIGPLYEKIAQVPVCSLCVRQIKTHSKPSIAADSLNFALIDYDKEVCDGYQYCVIIFGSNNMDNKKWCEPILRKHFNTEHVFWYPYDYDGIVLTIIRYK